MKMQPLISVIVPVYNGQDYLGKCIESIEAQTYENLEVIIINDGSTDATGQVLTGLKAKYDNIHVITMEDEGVSAARNAGLDAAKGAFVTFVDADEALVVMAGRSIPVIFSADGEDAFRAMETKTLASLGKQSGLVIATGGGCVTRSENYPLLQQNGSIFWLTRDLTKLPTDGRPLSQSSKLETMYQIRRPMYEAFANHIISNDGDLQETIDAILRIREGKS